MAEDKGKGKGKEIASPRPEDYTVGWICAIPKELTAARAMLDSTHGPLEAQPKHDENNYVLGSIGKHNVAIACLPEYGVVSAAVTAKSMQNTFPRLRFGLMVGIGGGIPSVKNDIRLGDIVVSLPEGQHGGVIQYDLGRVEVDGFHRLGTLNKPPQLLRTAVVNLRSARGLGRAISGLVDEAFGDEEDDDDIDEEYTYPAEAKDILFKATFNHVQGSQTCDSCLKFPSQIVERAARRTTIPRIFYGNIASGNSVIKNALERDALAKRDNVICFEMEAAGLMDNFPCLVIRGICDYADSHKNKKWQPYAAAVAAAYAKDLLSSVSSEAVAALDPIRKNMHWIVPRLINPFYTGRRDVLDKLRQQLCGTETGEQKRVVIWGIGGCGKSEVCLKFADENREKFWGIFWIDATDEESAKRGIAQAATMACLSDLNFKAAKLWFSNLETSWLLIFDNADNTTIDYSQFFPSGQKGCILFTTRNEQCSIYGTVGCYEFDKLAMSDAIKLLLKSSGFEERVWPERSKEAQMLVGDDVLAQHALAITQAGAFIKQGLCKLEEYRHMFEKEQERLLTHRPTQAKSIYGDVYATFEVSATAIQSSSDPKSIDALKLLEVLAFLYREVVPEEMFVRAWNFALEIAEWGENDRIGFPSLWHVNIIRKILHKIPSLQELDLVAFRQARQVLRSFSLITINPETDNMSMHPLVHKWAKDRLHPHLQIAAWATAASLLTLSTGDDLYNTSGKGVDYDRLNMIEPHVEYCFIQEPQGVFKICPPLDICRIFYRFTYVLYYMRKDEMAEKIGNRLLSRVGHEISPQSSNCQRVKYLVAGCQTNLGKYDEALQSLTEVVLFDKENKLDAENPDYLKSRHALAMAHREVGQYREAIDILEDVVNIRQRILASNDWDLLNTQHELARTNMDIGQSGKAIGLFQEVIRVRQEILPPTNPDLLSTQHELARANLNIGLSEKAIELFQEVIRIEQETLAPIHPNLLISQHELARAYMDIRAYEEAIKLLLEVVRIREKSLGPTHIHLLDSQRVLAEAYYELGEYQAALPIIQNVVEKRATIFKPGHPSREISEELLARCIFAIEKEEATNEWTNVGVEDFNENSWSFGASHRHERRASY